MPPRDPHLALTPRNDEAMSKKNDILCPLCRDTRQTEIADAYRNGEPAASLAARYGLCPSGLVRHLRHHSRPDISGPEAPEASVLSALRQARETGAKASAALFPKILQTDVKLRHSQAERQFRTLNLHRAEASRGDDRLSREEWNRILATLYKALEPYEEASAAVVAALENMEGGE